MLINDAGGIFTAERIDMPGAWQMPQGGVDEGESLKEAALRELEEETSIPRSAVTTLNQTNDWIMYDLPGHLLGKVWGGKYRGQKQHWFLLRLDGDEALINLDTDHPEFSRWKWSNADELIAEIVSFKRDVYEAVVKELLEG
jgi:putative (di)nucleoside polyphosphate hydrolase